MYLWPRAAEKVTPVFEPSKEIIRQRQIWPLERPWYEGFDPLLFLLRFDFLPLDGVSAIRYTIYMDERTACACGFRCGNIQFSI